MAHWYSLLRICDGWLSAEKACASPSSIPLFHARNKGCIDLRRPYRSGPGSVALGAVERVFARSSSGSDPFEIPVQPARRLSHASRTSLCRNLQGADRCRAHHRNQLSDLRITAGTTGEPPSRRHDGSRRDTEVPGDIGGREALDSSQHAHDKSPSSITRSLPEQCGRGDPRRRERGGRRSGNPADTLPVGGCPVRVQTVFDKALVRGPASLRILRNQLQNNVGLNG